MFRSYLKIGIFVSIWRESMETSPGDIKNNDVILFKNLIGSSHGG